MSTQFFYSKSTKLYVARKPLKINGDIKKAAVKNNITLSWDDEGRLNFIIFNEARKILESINSQMMTPVEYWLILKDAKEANDKDMIQSLMSNEFCEWLNRVYLIDNTYIDNPKILNNHKYKGKKKEKRSSNAKPGWFNPDNNIDYEEGAPKDVEMFREKHATSWKYWSPNFSVVKNRPRAPIRGYVTSVGKPSYDLGIPVDAPQPMQMVRECRKTPPCTYYFSGNN